LSIETAEGPVYKNLLVSRKRIWNPSGFYRKRGIISWQVETLTNVTINYEMFLPSGHHRQPRNTSVELDLAPSSLEVVIPGHACNPPYFSTLPYTLGTGSGLAQLQFWSVTDGTTGEVLAPGHISPMVGASDLTITAWYFPISGPGLPGGGSAIIDDAFSANLGRFIDDTFVDVTSDPSLTSNANVVGVVPTTVAETLVAYANVVSTPEPFKEWVLNGGFMPVGSTTLNVAKGTNGMAVAIYQSPPPPPPRIPPNIVAYNPWWWIETHGGLVPPGPNPWERELMSAVQQLTMTIQALQQQVKQMQESG
jgi:hypothetical protein